MWMCGCGAIGVVCGWGHSGGVLVGHSGGVGGANVDVCGWDQFGGVWVGP